MSRQPAVTIITADSTVAQRYRCQHLQQQFSLVGMKCDVCHLVDTSAIHSALTESSVVVLQRTPYDDFVESIISVAHIGGLLIIFDVDDLIFDWPVTVASGLVNGWGSVRLALYKHQVNCYRRTLLISDAVLASTTYLVSNVEALGKPGWAHRNALSIEMLLLSQQAHRERPWRAGRVVIGYVSGTPTHGRDFAQTKPVLQRILRAFPQVELRVIGYLDPGSGWGTCQGRVKQLPFVPWRKLPALLAQFDINIAPLEIDNPFCHGKSETKYMEAALVKVPTVASATDAFRHAIRHGDNGMLARTENDWEQSLSALIEDAEMRHEMGEGAHADVLRRYHPAVRARELHTTLNEISQHVRGRPLFEPLSDLAHEQQVKREPRRFHFEEFDSRRPSMLRRAWHTLRYRGLPVFLLQALVFGQARWSRLIAAMRRQMASQNTTSQVDSP